MDFRLDSPDDIVTMFAISPTDPIRINIPGAPIRRARPRICNSSKHLMGDGQRKLMKATAFTMKLQWRGPTPEGALDVSMVFAMPIPKYLERTVQEGDAHQKKPDIDNLIKFYLDAGNGILWLDDNCICRLSCFKCYSRNPHTEIIIRTHVRI